MEEKEFIKEEGDGKCEMLKMVGRMRGGSGDERQFSKGYQTKSKGKAALIK